MIRFRIAIVGLVALGSLAACAGQPASSPSRPSSTSVAASGSSTPLPTTASSTSALASHLPHLSKTPSPVTSAPATSSSLHPIRGGGPVAAKLTLTGTVESGVEHGCLLLTDRKSGRRVNLSGGNPSIVKAGATVTVVGVIRGDLMSYCQQGPIFQVLEAKKG
jgi:hypothetical protein